MIDSRDPAIDKHGSLVITKLWHSVLGLYIWEFFTTLEYEWNIIRGRRTYGPTIWIYSLARASALVGAILWFVMMDATSPINCQVAGSFVIVFSFLSISAASLLIVLRVIAVWNRNRVIVATAITVWVIEIAFLVQGASRFRAARVPGRLECGRLNTDTSELSLIALLVADIALLLIMLVGLFRRRIDGGGAFGLTQLLWRQGVIWLMIATAAEVPPVVFLILNLNDQLNIIFQVPSWITMIIAATRMHRSLVDFANESIGVAHHNSNLHVQITKRTSTTSTPLHRMEAVMDVVPEHRLTQLQLGGEDSCINTDKQLHEKSNGLSCDDDIERGV